jgi:hypothetical protein
MKQSSQVTLALKKLDKVSEDVKKIKKRKNFYGDGVSGMIGNTSAALHLLNNND